MPVDRVCHAGAAAGSPKVVAWASRCGAELGQLGSELADRVVSDPTDVLAWDEVADDHHVCVFAADAYRHPDHRSICVSAYAGQLGVF